MDYWIVSSISVFVISLSLTGIIIPQILLIAFRRKLFDEPDPRKIHHGAIPRLGGMAFMPSIFFAIACISGIGMLFYDSEMSALLFRHTKEISFASCSLMLMFLVGLADDLIGVRYRAKFVVQIVAGLFLVVASLSIDNLWGFLLIDKMWAPFGWLLTVLVAVYITNAINLIDGIDGLASGLSAVACLYYGIVLFMAGDYFYCFVAFATLGTLVPFYYYNVFGHEEKQEKIFMGDTGALTIGLLMTILSIHICHNGIGLENGMNPLVVAFTPLIVPCFDVLRVYLHRLRMHRNPFLPDKCHIHHKLLALGLRKTKAMVLIVVSSVLFTMINLGLSKILGVTWLVLLDVVGYALINILLTHLIRKREQIKSNKLYD
ncbi:MAG: glycosyltransferase family 4 protein [Muribaculaceae bacterium]